MLRFKASWYGADAVLNVALSQDNRDNLLLIDLGSWVRIEGGWLEKNIGIP